MFGWIAVIGTVTALIHSALPRTRRARLNALDDDYFQDDDFHDDNRLGDDASDTEPSGDSRHLDDVVEDQPVVDVADEAAIEFVPADISDDLEIELGARDRSDHRATTIDGWDPEEWALEEEWHDSDRGPGDEAMDVSDGEELVSTDDFGTRRTR
jgi:hypothetical protein